VAAAVQRPHRRRGWAAPVARPRGRDEGGRRAGAAGAAGRPPPSAARWQQPPAFGSRALFVRATIHARASQPTSRAATASASPPPSTAWSCRVRGGPGRFGGRCAAGSRPPSVWAGDQAPPFRLQHCCDMLSGKLWLCCGTPLCQLDLQDPTPPTPPPNTTQATASARAPRTPCCTAACRPLSWTMASRSHPRPSARSSGALRAAHELLDPRLGCGGCPPPWVANARAACLGGPPPRLPPPPPPPQLDAVHTLFETLFEWDLFSVRVETAMLSLLPQILLSIPEVRPSSRLAGGACERCWRG
jgi:hypothetical protein